MIAEVLPLAGLLLFAVGLAAMVVDLFFGPRDRLVRIGGCLFFGGFSFFAIWIAVLLWAALTP